MQELQLLDPAAAYVPAEQEPHVPPAVGFDVPPTQLTHADDDVDPAGELVPAAHAVTTVEVQYDPAGHCVHEVAPTPE